MQVFPTVENRQSQCECFGRSDVHVRAGEQQTDDYGQPDTAESGGTNKAFTGAFSDRFLGELWFATCTLRTTFSS
jgi:hypothetical protein